MALKASAFVLSAVGVAAFYFGLFGGPREWSLEVSIIGLALLLIGIAVLLFAVRGARLRAPHMSLVIVVALAVALHAYEALINSSNGLSLGFFLWPLSPYALCLVVAALSTSSIPALAGAVAALLFDLGAHYSVFIQPSGSTAGLALLFLPLWNTLVIAPVVMFVAWLFRWVSAKANAP